MNLAILVISGEFCQEKLEKKKIFRCINHHIKIDLLTVRDCGIFHVFYLAKSKNNEQLFVWFRFLLYKRLLKPSKEGVSKTYKNTVGLGCPSKAKTKIKIRISSNQSLAKLNLNPINPYLKLNSAQQSYPRYKRGGETIGAVMDEHCLHWILNTYTFCLIKLY